MCLYLYNLYMKTNEPLYLIKIVVILDNCLKLGSIFIHMKKKIDTPIDSYT